MEKEYINIILPDGRTKTIKRGMRLLDLAKEFQGKYKTPFVLARVNNVFKELSQTITDDLAYVEFLD